MKNIHKFENDCRAAGSINWWLAFELTACSQYREDGESTVFDGLEGLQVVCNNDNIVDNHQSLVVVSV